MLIAKNRQLYLNLACVVIGIAAFLLCSSYERSRILTQQELARCWGETIYCCDPIVHSRFRQEVCLSVSCQPCISQTHRRYTCRGNRGNPHSVEECVKTNSPGSRCQVQPVWIEGLCTVDVWAGEVCRGEPLREDYPWMTNDCM